MTNYVSKCLPGLTEYTVKENENIYQVVQQFRIPLAAIKAANPRTDVENVNVGDTLCLPMQQNFPACENGKFYFIQAGDSYYQLAVYFSLSVKQLMQANPNTDPNNLQIGQAICIPVHASYSNCTANATPYQLKQGDSFYHLSKVFQVPLEAIIQLNPHVNPNQLSVGQFICLPVKWNYYFNQYYHVAFRYPSDWQQTSYFPVRYQGESGYFEVKSIIAARPSNPSQVTSIGDLANSYATNQNNPYGKNPTVEQGTINGQSAAIIIPSNDQAEDFNGRSALILQYPRPYPIGDGISHYLLIYTNKQYVKGIASTLKLLNVDTNQRLIKEQAAGLLRRALRLTGQPEVHVDYDHTENGQYVIHVYDIVNNHTATRGWYLVDPITGEITDYM
ncbi:LysM peptidoglycan-binding domain-containing protein [Radiobacillus sp. PE A8.2]|uniref:LysM peptidoglycan-binding domain-containing protein n=1 Tax=Radiobacillus sp. PE A8.2 TaxID=3380349 RepID=UPI00388E1560